MALFEGGGPDVLYRVLAAHDDAGDRVVGFRLSLVVGERVESEAAVITQAADAKIAGKCQVNGSETTEIEGAAKDAGFKFAFTVMGYTLTYSGTVEGDSMTGDIEVAGATGKFTGKRTK